MDYETLEVRQTERVCTIAFRREERGNVINREMIEEFRRALDGCGTDTNIVVIEGGPDVFCSGADFQELSNSSSVPASDPQAVYEIWHRLATGPFIAISHVRGRATAGGVGFVAASDIVIAGPQAQFGLSELLFGVYPACVMPFLIRRVGFQRAHYLTLMTRPVGAEEAHRIGLVDAYDAQSRDLLRKHLLRLRNLSGSAISRYKRYMGEVYRGLTESRAVAVAANVEAFSDATNLANIARYLETGSFPWQ